MVILTKLKSHIKSLPAYISCSVIFKGYAENATAFLSYIFEELTKKYHLIANVKFIIFFSSKNPKSDEVGKAK